MAETLVAVGGQDLHIERAQAARRSVSGLSRGRRAGLLLTITLATGACGSAASGYDSPPASLDPGSPHLAAIEVQFDQQTLVVAAGRAFILVLENRDSLPHNVSIYADAALRQRRFEGVVFTGPATRWYPVPALDAGTYVFACDLHPNMRGLLEAR